MEHFDELSPRARARITGVIYLAYFVLAILGAVFLQQAGISALTPNTTGSATIAHSILANESALQLGVALGLISTVLYVAVTSLFYLLFRPVSRTIALLALAFGLVAMAITAVGSLFELAPLAVLRDSSSDLSTSQLESVAAILLRVGDEVGPVSLVFSGFFQLAIGYVMFRSGFLPRIFGVLVAVAGAGWLLYLAPPLADRLMTLLEVLGFLGEAPLMLWLLVMGINSERWRESAARARPHIAA